jgi:hypothetical protein
MRQPTRRALRWCHRHLWLFALAACTPYDPSLPPTPFLCGDQEPRCPEGYTCVTERDARMVCRADSLVSDAGLPDAAAPASALR